MVLPQQLHLPALLLAPHVHAQRLPTLQLAVLTQLLVELLERVRPQAEQPLQSVVPVLLVLVDAQEAVVDGLEQLRQQL